MGHIDDIIAIIALDELDDSGGTPVTPGGGAGHYWYRPSNYVLRSEISTPSTTASNLIFSDAEFASMSAGDITDEGRPIEKALLYKITGNASEATDCFNRLFADLGNEGWNPDVGYSEHTKNPFGLMWACAICLDWCKTAWTTTQQDSILNELQRMMEAGPNTVWNPRLHTDRLAGHPATFWSAWPFIAIAAYGRQPGLWTDLLDAHYLEDARRAVNFYTQSGVSVHGSYTSAKMAGYLGMELAFKLLIPEGKTMFSAMTQNIAYSNLLYPLRHNRLLMIDDFNDNGFGGGSSRPASITGFSLPLYGYRNLLIAHQLLYQDPAVQSLINALPSIQLLYYDKFVTPRLYEAGDSVYNYDSNQVSLATLPNYIWTDFPISMTIYKSDHTFDQNNNKNWAGYRLNKNETFVSNHDTLHPGCLEIYGPAGHMTFGRTGVGSNKPYNSHEVNVFKGWYGMSGIGRRDNREDWDHGFDTNRLQQDGVRFPLKATKSNGSVEPEDFDNQVQNPAFGFFLCEQYGRFADKLNNPDALYDCIDLTKGFRGDNVFMYNRMNRVTRSVFAFPLLQQYAILHIVIDKVDITGMTSQNPLRPYQQWVSAKTIGISGNRFETTSDYGKAKTSAIVKSNRELELTTYDQWPNGMSPTVDNYVPESGKGDRLAIQPTQLHNYQVFVTVLLTGFDDLPSLQESDVNICITPDVIIAECKNRIAVEPFDPYHTDYLRFKTSHTNQGIYLVGGLSAGEYAVNGGNPITVQDKTHALSFKANSGTHEVLQAGKTAPSGFIDACTVITPPPVGEGYIMPVAFDELYFEDFQDQRGTTFDNNNITTNGVYLHHQHYREADVITEADNSEVAGSLNGFAARQIIRQYRDGSGNLEPCQTRNSNTEDHSRSELFFQVPKSLPNASSLYGLASGKFAANHILRSRMDVEYVYQWRMKLTKRSEKGFQRYCSGSGIDPNTPEDYDWSLIDLKQDGGTPNRSRDATYRMRVMGDYITFIQNVHPDYREDYADPGRIRKWARIHYPQLWSNEWITFTLSVKWGNDSSCYLQQYIDGELLYSDTGLNVFHDDQDFAPYWKLGPYSAAYRYAHPVGAELREVFLDYVSLGIKKPNGKGNTKYSGL